MATAFIEVLDAIGAVRGLLLVAAATAAWRAGHLARLDDERDPLPWAIALILLLAVLAIVSLKSSTA